MLARLSNKTILVAGAGGIGGELARRYAAEGANVVLGDAKTQAAEEALAGLEECSGRVLATRLDGSNELSIREAVDLACAEFGGLDGLHANFASFADGLLQVGALDLPLDVYDEVMRVNARGFLICTQAALPRLLARGGGSIVYTSSGAAHASSAVRAAYAMSKAAVHALMRVVATRHGPDNIRANAVAPGVILHEALADATGEEFRKWALSRTPIKARLGKPADVAAISALLMSDEGSYITGQVISVDGGSTMRP
jgi:NAD(P)-dependent dehydrogenase (short-subunit alcohol dehydrogenase family)